MKRLRITYVSSRGGEPFAATIGTRYMDRQPGETLDNFKLRCEAMLHMMMQE